MYNQLIIETLSVMTRISLRIKRSSFCRGPLDLPSSRTAGLLGDLSEYTESLLLPSQDMEARKKSSAENNETKISTRICAGCTLSWEDFGDPAKEASNRYFFQTQVSVQGVPTSLANITEEQAMNLPKEEFHAWEQAHIQIYMGTQASHNTVQK